MYLPAFAQIADHFHSTVPRVSLSLSSYFLGLALGQVLYGPLLDRFGRKKPLYLGLGLYILASVACVLSPTVESLIGARFLQALGGCAAQVASVAMVRDFFKPEEGAKIFSRLMLIVGVSPMFAPTAGSFVATTWGWQTVFAILALIVILILAATAVYLPEGHEPDESISLSPLHIAKTFHAILTHRQFVTYAVSGAFSFSGLFAYLSASPAIFMAKYHLTTQEFGGVFAILSIGMIGGGQFNVLLSRHVSIAKIFKAALYLQLAMGLLYVIACSAHVLNLYSEFAILFIYISCVGLVYPNAAALALAPFEKNSGSAAALLGTLQMIVGATAAAVFGVLNFDSSLVLAVLFFVAAIFGASIFKIARAKRHSSH